MTHRVESIGDLSNLIFLQIQFQDLMDNSHSVLLLTL